MDNWYSNVYKAFIFAGIVSFILGFFTGTKTSLGAYMAGYSVLILAILMILTMLFNKILTVGGNDSTSQTIYSILTITGPFILILTVITFVLYLLIKYQSNIVNGKTPPGYDSFSNIIVILLVIQIYLIYNNLGSDRFDATGKLPKITSSILYLTGVISGISSILLYTNLKYYSTDGFTNDLT